MHVSLLEIPVSPRRRRAGRLSFEWPSLLPPLRSLHDEMLIARKHYSDAAFGTIWSNL